MCKVVKARLSCKFVTNEVLEEDEMMGKWSEVEEATDKMLGICLVDGKVSDGKASKSDGVREVAPDEEELELWHQL